MNISCEIVKDLLPLYHDGVCSDDSKRMIEEHLNDCDNCTFELQAMDNELSINTTTQNLTEAEAVKNLSKKWKKGMILSLVKGIIITILAIAVFALILYGFMDIRMVPKPY